jgi:hypothetical protein
MDEATSVATTVAARPTNPSPTRWSAFKYVLFAFAPSRYLIIMASALAFAYSEHWPHPEAYPQWLNVFTEDCLARVPALVTRDDATWYLLPAS